MTKEELHKLIENQQPNICQIEAIRDGKTVYSENWTYISLDFYFPQFFLCALIFLMAQA